MDSLNGELTMELFLLTILAAGFTYAMHLGGKGPKNEPFPSIHSKWELNG